MQLDPSYVSATNVNLFTCFAERLLKSRALASLRIIFSLPVYMYVYIYIKLTLHIYEKDDLNHVRSRLYELFSFCLYIIYICDAYGEL